MAKTEYKCPYCGSKVRVNTKRTHGTSAGSKQASCTSYPCQAKGPMAATLKEAKGAFCGVDIAELLERDAFLSCLEAAGVDNWGGYDDAQEMMEDI